MGKLKMCIMVYAPQGARFPLADVPAFFRSNKDGIGAAFGDGRKVRIFRAMVKNAEEATAFCKDVIGKAKGRSLIVHFRFATHGAINLDNVHPFRLCGSALFHNGVLDIDTETGEVDTAVYCARYLAPIIGNRSAVDALAGPLGEVIGSHIDTSNKFAVIDKRGKVAIVNEASGAWYNGVWLSNMNWKPRNRIQRGYHWKDKAAWPGYAVDTTFDRWSTHGEWDD